MEIDGTTNRLLCGNVYLDFRICGYILWFLEMPIKAKSPWSFFPDIKQTQLAEGEQPFVKTRTEVIAA
jgi:hypothetical protein